MKKIVLTLMSVIMITTMFSCNKDNNSGNGNNGNGEDIQTSYNTLIIGDWDVKTIKFNGVVANYYMPNKQISFNEDGTGTIGNEESGWLITGRTLSINTLAHSYSYTITKLTKDTCFITGTQIPGTDTTGNVEILMVQVDISTPEIDYDAQYSNYLCDSWEIGQLDINGNNSIELIGNHRLLFDSDKTGFLELFDTTGLEPFYFQWNISNRRLNISYPYSDTISYTIINMNNYNCILSGTTIPLPNSEINGQVNILMQKTY